MVVGLIEGDYDITIRLDYAALVNVGKFIIAATPTFRHIIDSINAYEYVPITEDQ